MRLLTFLALAAATLSCNGTGDAPAAEAGHPFIEHVLGYPGIEWRSVTTEHFVVHGMAGAYPGDNVPALAEAAERAREHVLRRLGEPEAAEPRRPHVFLVRGPEDFRELVGQPAGGWTEPEANAVLAAVSEAAAPALRHELGHLYSHRLWGRPHAPWLSEGVAVFAVGHCAGIPLHQWASAIQRGGEPASILPMQREFDFTRAAPHLLAGSFVTFVADRYGLDAVRTAWRHGLEAMARSLGSSPEALDASWQADLRETDLPPNMPDFSGRVRCETLAG
jgi:hypothetical protein